MTSKHDKKGPELLMVTPEMLLGLDNLSAQFKKAGDNATYDYLTQVKNALVKYPSLARHAQEMAAMQRNAAKALIESADFIEQLMP